MHGEMYANAAASPHSVTAPITFKFVQSVGRYKPPFQLNKGSQLPISLHNETLSIAAMCVNNPDRSPSKIQRLGKSPSLMTDSALMRLASGCSMRLVLTLKGASKCQNT